MLHQFNVRRPEGWGFDGARQAPWLWVGFVVVMTATAAAVFTPLADVLGLDRPPADGWIVIAAMSVTPLLLIQSFRWVRRTWA